MSLSHKPRVLFLTDRGERHQQHALACAPPNLDVVMLRTPEPDVLMSALAEADFIITERNQPITASMIEAAPHLGLIVRLGSLDYDIDHAAAKAAGIAVETLPVMGTMLCAEHALMMTLALCKRLGRSLHAARSADHGLPAQRGDENTFAFNWLKYRDIGGLAGKTIGVLGMGEIGVELARRLAAFRPAAVLYHKRTPYPHRVERTLGIRFAAFEDCIRGADILVSLLPYSAETDYHGDGPNALRRARLEWLKRGACLVHLGSGSVLDENALADLLRSGHLAGAALDTYEYEPLQPDHPLIALARDPNANVLLTPHTAAASASADRSGDFAPILRYLDRA